MSISTTDLTDMLTMHRKARVQADIKSATDKILDIIACIPADDERWEEEQRGWGKEWDDAEDNLLVAVEVGKEFDLFLDLDSEVSRKIEEAGRTRRRWREMHPTIEDATPTVRRATPPMEDPSPNPTHATTVTTSDVGMDGSQPSVVVEIPTLRKRSRAEVHDEDEEHRPLKQGEVTHAVPCGGCRDHGAPCIGVPSRTCRRCYGQKISCEKSSGRGGWRLNKNAKAAATKRGAGETRKVPSRPTCTPRAGPSHGKSSPVDPFADINEVVLQKKKRGKPAGMTSGATSTGSLKINSEVAQKVMAQLEQLHTLLLELRTAFEVLVAQEHAE